MRRRSRARTRVTRAGRCSWRPGHHNVAAELRGAPNVDPRLGPLTDFVAELARIRPSRAILSAEDLALAYDRPEAFVKLRCALAAIGYRTRLVLYVRTHDEYVESVYSEAVQHGYTMPFERLLGDNYPDRPATTILAAAERVAV
jgi:hypothetical protein